MSTLRAFGTVRDPGLCPPETFFKAQRRNRRATWRMSALCVVAAALMGIPLTLVLTPFLYAVAMALLEAINHFSPLPPGFWERANDFARLAQRVADYVVNQRGTVNPQELAIGLALVLLPGIALTLVLWVGVRLLFRHGGVGGTLASLGARAPNSADLKELQLADVAQEMAIAAGLPAPQVMLIDSPGANAAAIGTSPQDARIVLSRRLLDDLDREQTQALLAHLVASIGNGDLHIAFTVTSVFETCGLLVSLVSAPFGKQSRATLWKIIRYAFQRGPAAAKAAEAEDVAGLLADTLDMNSNEVDRFYNQPRAGLIRKFFRLVLFPFCFTTLAVEITLWFFVSVLLGPAMALLWRTRRYLADAGAIELTRNPDALAAVLQRLSADTTAVAGGSWATHLFLVNPAGDRTLREPSGSEDQRRKAVAAWRLSASAAAAGMPAGPLASVAAVTPDEFARARKEMTAVAMTAARGDANAVARMLSFAKAMGGPSAFGLSQLPDPNDIVLARQGDRAALARLRMLRLQHEEGPSRRGHTGLQTHSYISFHPPLDKRTRRLQRMGSHVAVPNRHRSVVLKIALTLLYVIVVPLLTLACLMMLLVIAMMIGLNLLFLALWLTVLHWAFAQDWQRNFEALVKIAGDLIALLRKAS